MKDPRFPPIVRPNGDQEIHPVLEDRITRARMIERGIIIPTTQELYDPWYVRDLPALALDDKGRREAAAD